MRIVNTITDRLIAKVARLAGEDFAVALVFAKLADNKFDGGTSVYLQVTDREILDQLPAGVTANDINTCMGRLNRAGVIEVETFCWIGQGDAFVVNPQQFV